MRFTETQVDFCHFDSVERKKQEHKSLDKFSKRPFPYSLYEKVVDLQTIYIVVFPLRLKTK